MTSAEGGAIAGTERRLALALAVVVAALFAPAVVQLGRVWAMDANYSHGFLVLPLALFLAWRAVRNEPVPEHRDGGLGLFSLAVGLGFHLFYVVTRFLPAELIAALLTLRGLAVVCGGRVWARRLLFPTLFLAFLFPLPAGLMTHLAIWLQELVARTSAEVLGLFYVCHRQGHTLRIAGTEPMFVAQECSGVRQLVAFAAMGALFAYLARAGLWRGLVFVALALPVAVVANVVRVVMMSVGIRVFGASWIFTWMHDIPAMVTMPLGIVAYFVLVWLFTPDAPKADTPQTEATP